MSTANVPPKIACPHCQAMIKAPALAAGSSVNCPKCGKGFRLGGGDDTPASQPKVPTSAATVESRTSKVEGPRASQPRIHSNQKPANPKSEIQNPESPVSSTASAFPNIRPPASGKPRELDILVDPNLLAPPPPREKPKPTTVSVVCGLCGTRMDVPLAKIGYTVQCPDCHIVNEVKAPQQPKAPPPKGPTLEGAESFALSDPGDRPAYRPLQAARGEYEILSALDPAHTEHGWKLPAGAAAAVAADDEEMRLEAPVVRVELAPPPVKLPDPEPDPEDKLRDGRYNDGLIGENVDRREAEAWKKSPFLIGVVEFLIQPEALGRIGAYGFGLALALNLAAFTTRAAMSSEALWRSSALLFSMVSAVSLGLWMMPFAATVLTIVQDTGNGSKEVDNWPSWDPTHWFFPALFVTAAVLISGLPGMFLTTGLFSSAISSGGWESGLFMAAMLTAPLPLSWLILLPIVLYSMLAENSIFAVASRQTLASLRAASEGWMLFYLFSTVLFLVVGAAGSLIFLDNFLAIGAGAVGLVILAFLYARLLGRLMWYGNQQVAKRAKD